MTRTKIIQQLGTNLAVEPKAKCLDKQERNHYILETLQLRLNEVEEVPAYFAYPKNCNKENKRPLVLFNHSHGGDFERGKTELVESSAYLQRESFVDALTQAGYAVGSIDMWGFGERRGKPESELFKEVLIQGQTLWGLRLFDNQQFLTYLLNRPEINAERVATIGMSMGGMMSWWLAAIDERIKVIIDIAGQVEYESLVAERQLDRHGFYYYVPGILKEHSTFDIQKLIAPRPRLSLVGREDRLCPMSGVNRLDQQLKESYAKQQKSENWQCKIVSGGHQETKEMRVLWQTFLRNHL